MNILSQHTIKYVLSLLSASMVVLSFLLSFSAHSDEKASASITKAQPVKFKARTDDNFLLAGDYYIGEKKSGGVIVLHDCKSDRSRYRLLANALSQQGLHTLALDLRGYGDSVSPAYSRANIKKSAKSIVEYQSEMALLTSYWQEDLISAYQYLQTKVDPSKGVAIVTSGCSSAYGIELAEKILLNSIVMITPQVTYADKERYKNLIDIPSYFITSSLHSNSYLSAQELFAWNGSKKSKMQIFKGERYNYSLVMSKKTLVGDIAHWVKFNVSK